MTADIQTPEIHLQAQKLIVEGYLPPPFSVDPFDGRAVWSFTELALLFDRRPDELIELLRKNGPAFSTSDRGVPSSWQMFIER